MSTLFKLKDFFTLEETVNHLSNNLKEPVFLSDIYRFVLDGQLTFSVRFINPTYGLKGLVISGADGDKFKINSDLATGEKLAKPYFGFIDDDAVPIDIDKWFVCDEEVYSVDGIWDFLMLGLEKLEVERLYSTEVNAPEPLYTDSYGLYLKQGNVVCRLQNKSEDFSIPEEEIESLLDFGGVSEDEFLSGTYGDLNENEIKRIKYLSSPEGFYSDFYEDSISFEEQSHQYVIKSQELERFSESLKEGSMQETEPPAKKAFLKDSLKHRHNISKTKTRHLAWQNEATEIKKKHRSKSKLWIAKQIAKLSIAEGRSADTIRKYLNI